MTERQYRFVGRARFSGNNTVVDLIDEIARKELLDGDLLFVERARGEPVGGWPEILNHVFTRTPENMAAVAAAARACGCDECLAWVAGLGAP